MSEEIPGVFVKDLETHVDDRGLLTELVRIDWLETYNLLEKGYVSAEEQDGSPDSLNADQLIQQVYMVQNHQEAIRAYHKHDNLIDLFCLIKGHAKFVLIDPKTNNKKVVNVSDKKLQLIGVPAGIYHGWKGSEGSILMSVANRLYMGEDKKGELDEERIPWDMYGKDIWDTTFK